MPQLVYHVVFKLGVPDWKNIAEAEILFANINQKIRTYAQIHVGPEAVENVFKKILLYRFPQAMTAKSTYIFSSDYDADITSMKFLNQSGFGPFNETYWQRGFYLQHIFDLAPDCAESPACTFLKNQKAVITSLHVKGYWPSPFEI